ncbi:hypothetical protein QMO56_08805 [Roseomonas sp. E05]|uniref:hypothetical protein n=1 Tax=Roseomonas sp. E05 TaxID=3046310 RepID=UPI0024BB19CA|nr:hypothetical protein [Roseomonas sp. E05]MDJ0388212.1 hypothetical protein [Roseomonas sp. E05]
MMDRKPTQSETTAERRPSPAAPEGDRYDTFRSEAGSGYASWNSWGERNPLTLGSFGRW